MYAPVTIFIHPFLVILYPPPVGRVLILSYLSRFLLKTSHLIPRLWAGDIVDVLNLLIIPDSVMHALPTQRFQRVVDVRKRSPTISKYVREEGFICKGVIQYCWSG